MSTDFRDRAILALLAGGFLLLALETLHLHRVVVQKTAAGWLPVLTCTCALICCFLLAIGVERLREVCAGVFAASIAIGVIGCLFHVRGDLRQLTALIGLNPEPLPIEAGVTRPEDDTRATSGIAPLSISGLSGVGLLLAWPHRRRFQKPTGGQGVAYR